MEDLGFNPSYMPAASYVFSQLLSFSGLSHSICEMGTASLIALISCEDSMR